jgi:threonine dehydrogenase-like Zn-dependent dehydrogenase
MKKAIISGVHKAEIVECPTPKATEELTLVKIYAAPMCTEYKVFNEGRPEKYLGHEAAGEVVETPKYSGLNVGERVVVMPQYPCGECALCKSGEFVHCEHNKEPGAWAGQTEGWATYAQYVLKPAWLLPKIPGGLDYDTASLANCGLGPTFGAMQTLRVSAFDTVLITGLGPVGLGGVINAKFCNARVIAVDVNAWRLNFAGELGADLTVDSCDPDATKKIKEFTGGLGADCAVDCSGVPEAQRLCVDAIRRKGGMAFVGAGAGNLSINCWNDMIVKGINLSGAWNYNLNDFHKLIQVCQKSPLLGKFITHKFPLGEIQKAFEVSASSEHGKIILHPWE